MRTLLLDASHACRRLRRNAGFTVTAAVTLALGIGCATAIFSVVDAVLLRPFAWKQPERLVALWIVRPHWRTTPALAPSWNRGFLSWPNLRDLQQHSRVLESVAVWRAAAPVFSGEFNEAPQAMLASSGFLATLGVPPTVGRFFDPREDEDATDSVVISHQAWRARFGADPAVLGRSVTLDGVPRTVIGVLAPNFTFQGLAPEFVLPFGNQPAGDRSHENHAYQAVARLKAGISVGDALRDVEPILRAGEPPEQRTARLQSLTDMHLGEARRPLWMLAAGAGFLMLIACANVAGLLLGEMGKRRHEMAVRVSLGASQERLFASLFIESLALGLLSGALGIVIAAGLVPALLALAPASLPRLDATTLMDSRVLMFCIAMAVLCALIFGAGPALTTSRTALAWTMREGRDPGLSRRRFRGLLVVGEMAIAFVVLASASLLGETLFRLRTQPVGFESDNLIVLSVRLPRTAAAQNASSSAQARVLQERLRTLPGISQVAAAATMPFFGGYGSNRIEIEGEPLVDLSASRQVVTTPYFATLGIPLLKGRLFEEGTGDGHQAIVSESFEARFLRGSAIGRRFRFNLKSDAWYEIVGVVADARQRGLAETIAPMFYVPHTSVPSEWVLRTNTNPRSLIPMVRDEMRARDSRLIVTNIDTMENVIRRTIAPEEFRARVAAIFGAAALFLSVVGVYALLSRSVSERAHEIGVRMALGAQTADVLRAVVAQGIALVTAGVLVGVPGAFIAARWLTSMLYGVSPTAAHTFAVVSLGLIAVAVIATMIPARRAARVDPVVALRHE